MAKTELENKLAGVPTEETIKEELETVDGRTALGKRLKAMEDTLADLKKRIEVCEVHR